MRRTYYIEWERHPNQLSHPGGSGTINVVAETIEEACADARASLVHAIDIKAVTRSPR